MIVYTDGAYSSSKAVGGFGVIAVDEITNKPISFYSEKKANTTNNREELKAILYALLTFGKELPPPIVYSDSAYSVNTFNNWMWNWASKGWIKSDNKVPENLDLIQSYYDYWLKGYRINLQKCKGHSGDYWNEQADKLAKEAYMEK